MMKLVGYFLLLVVMLGMLAGFVARFLNSQRECEERGGALVQGAFGFACVAGAGARLR